MATEIARMENTQLKREVVTLQVQYSSTKDLHIAAHVRGSTRTHHCTVPAKIDDPPSKICPIT